MSGPFDHDELRSRLWLAGLDARASLSIAACADGGNNRVFRLKLGQNEFALKTYLTPASGHDRLLTEWHFLQRLQAAGISDVPQPVFADAERGFALYTFVEGRKLAAGEVAAGHVASAASFLRKLNSDRVREICCDLGDAAEAAFTLDDHLAVVRSRLLRLHDVDDVRLSSLLSRMESCWEALQALLATGTAEIGMEPPISLSPEERCLSPSDFGFHNMLLRPDGSLAFIDFEYAGWDDPAKLVADFFFQPAIRPDESFFDSLADAALGRVPFRSLRFHLNRIHLLRPLFGLKWCCIMLNPFEHGWAQRRLVDRSEDRLRRIQDERLDSAARNLERVNGLMAAMATRGSDWPAAY